MGKPRTSGLLKIEKSAWSPKSILVTGGCGFIGSNFINWAALKWPLAKLVNLDKLNLGAETVNNVELSVRQSDRYQFVCGDYKNEQLVTDLLQSYEVDLVVNFAAESNVDVSFAHPAETFANNVNSLMGLLESCWQHGSLVKFVHISTDEVYGESGWGVVAPKVESDPFKPTNPYAISKTAAEQLVNYYRLTANLPVVIVRMNNVFGPRQDGTKVTPKFIQQISRGQLVTIQGSGKQLRTWLYVSDAIEGIRLAAEKGRIGEIYNFGSQNECNIVALAEEIHKSFGQIAAGVPTTLQFQSIPDRPHNDRRYLISSEKALVRLNPI